MNSDGVYPSSDWNDPDELSYVAGYFAEMKSYIAGLEKAGSGMVTYIF